MKMSADAENYPTVLRHDYPTYIRLFNNEVFVV